MIVVSGEPRSGTSMAMLIVRELGFTIAGKKHPMNKDNNPDGTWEIPGIVMNGITSNIVEGRLPSISPKIEEECIKLMTCAVCASENALIDKIIYCIRIPAEVIASQLKLAEAQKMDMEVNNELDLFKSYATSMYNFFTGVIPKYPVLIMNYNIAIFNPKMIVNAIAEFLGVEATESACGVIKEKYYRNRR